ncbi:MAG TPA: hypothetical protein PKU94_07290 [Candidatus Hydrothermia bacterium]|nr:hypothetical protein [Candidatus Hydrothermia bacterium]HOL24377.1 hypothetical protein [Candidatus Hydrothermia bacterium]HOP33163.1 hypothetical protein [Candidatus Hydrothermia bacterium]HPO79356.1 hypothetical protein [Candidatus Hydrothermia bacterium]
MKLAPVWLMQPIPYMGEDLEGVWIIEQKVDGWRMQIIKSDKGIEFWGRRLEKQPNWTEKLSYLSKYLESIPDNTLLDTEITSEKGRRFIPSLFKKTPDVKAIIYVFDVIYYKGREVFTVPLKERKLLLQDLNLKDPFQLMPYEKLHYDVKTMVINAKRDGFEGIVLKEFFSLYEIGKGGPIATIFWRKAK